MMKYRRQLLLTKCCTKNELSYTVGVVAFQRLHDNSSITFKVVGKKVLTILRVEIYFILIDGFEKQFQPLSSPHF